MYAFICMKPSGGGGERVGPHASIWTCQTKSTDKHTLSEFPWNGIRFPFIKLYEQYSLRHTLRCGLYATKLGPAKIQIRHGWYWYVSLFVSNLALLASTMLTAPEGISYCSQFGCMRRGGIWGLVNNDVACAFCVSAYYFPVCCKITAVQLDAEKLHTQRCKNMFLPIVWRRQCYAWENWSVHMFFKYCDD